MGEGNFRKEWLKCKNSVHYFVHTYVQIYDATEGVWMPFSLWQKQADALYQIRDNRLVIILKARQLGMTWLCLAFILWLMLFYPVITALVFSRRDDEATYLLDRLRGMYDRLPEWLQCRKVLSSNAHIWQLSNGSITYAFPTTAGDSYTASIALVDEADLVPDLGRLMNAVKPTIDGGGRMLLLSRADKDNPGSQFKQMYRAARAGRSPWKSVFLPWFSRPARTAEWYESQKTDVFSRTGSLDDLYQQYPATDEEALQARTLDKRIPPAWLDQCYMPSEPLTENPLGIGSLVLYEVPGWHAKYVIGADPAEGNPTSDASSAHVIDVTSGKEVAKLADQIEPTTFAIYLNQLATYYNDAGILVERNNHGHAVLGYLHENTNARILDGWDGEPGWHTTTRGKALLWSVAADSLRDNLVTIRSQSTYTQLNAIDGKTLSAPKGMADDEAVSFALAVRAFVGLDDYVFAYGYTEDTAKAWPTRRLR